MGVVIRAKTEVWRGLAFGLGLCAALEAQAAWVDEAGLILRFDDNLSRGQLSRDIKGDTALVASVAKGAAHVPSGRDRLSMSFNLSATAHRHYTGLDNVEAGLTLGYRHKFGLGLLAPELRASAAASRLAYRDAPRDGWLYTGELALARRFTPRLAAELAYRYDQRTADHVADRLRPFLPADVFDIVGHTLRLGGEYVLGDQYVISVAYAVREGDVVSTTLRNLPVFLASDAIAEDTVFGSGRFAYRMEALTRSVSLGLSRLIGERSSFTIGYEHHDSVAKQGVDYQSNRVTTTFLLRF